MYQSKIFFCRRKVYFFNFDLLNSHCTGTEDAKCLTGLDVLWFLIIAVDYIYIYIYKYFMKKGHKGSYLKRTPEPAYCPIIIHITRSDLVWQLADILS